MKLINHSLLPFGVIGSFFEISRYAFEINEERERSCFGLVIPKLDLGYIG